MKNFLMLLLALMQIDISMAADIALKCLNCSDQIFLPNGYTNNQYLQIYGWVMGMLVVLALTSIVIWLKETFFEKSGNETEGEEDSNKEINPHLFIASMLMVVMMACSIFMYMTYSKGDDLIKQYAAIAFQNSKFEYVEKNTKYYSIEDKKRRYPLKFDGNFIDDEFNGITIIYSNVYKEFYKVTSIRKREAVKLLK